MGLRFRKQPQKYNDFNKILDDSRSKDSNVSDIITRVIELFQGHPDLMVGFNAFLPPGYKIEPGEHAIVVQIPQVYTTR